MRLPWPTSPPHSRLQMAQQTKPTRDTGLPAMVAICIRTILSWL